MVLKGITLISSSLFSIVAIATTPQGPDENRGGAASPARIVQADTTAKVDFNIPKLSLADALAEWARQTGMQVLRRDTDSTIELTTRSITGKFSPAEALEKMLATTGLTYEFVNDRTVRIAPLRANLETTSFSPGGKGIKGMILARNADAADTREAQTTEAASSGNAESLDSSQEFLQEVLVTGSRIARDSFTTSTPMLAIDSAEIARSGFNNLSDILLRSPLVAAGIGASTANYSADAGASFIDLRGLGVQRTLTLIDGRRRVAGTQTSSAVDLSAIPAALVERVEVITGGASAVYGADAVTGVVNVVLKRDFDGLEAFARVGQSKYGDGNSYSAGLTGGTAFSAARGQLSFGFNYNEDHPIFLRDRPFAKQNPTTVSNPGNTGPADGIPDIMTLENWRIRDVSVPGTFNVGGISYLYDGQLRPLQNDQEFGNFGIAGDGFTNVPYNPLRVGLKTLSGLTDLRYGIGDSTTLFAQLSMANTRAHDPRQPMSDRGMIIRRDNPFVPAAVQQLMDDNSLTQIALGRSQRDLGVQYNDSERTTYTLLAGLEGTAVSDEWQWELAYQYGRNNSTSNTRSRNQARFLQAIDAAVDPQSSQPICRSPEARAAGCVPLNVMGIDVASPAALAWIMHTRVRDIDTTQQIASGQISGDLLDLPAGPLKFVAGAEHRKERLTTEDDGLATTGGLYRLDNGGPPIDAEFDVSEAFVEVVAPLMRDLPFAHRLEIEGAARHSDYSTIGDTVAWKAGALWAPIPDMRLRVTRSRSVRAPTLNELYSPGVNSLVNVVDPCGASQINAHPNRVANCAALGVPVGFVDPRSLTARTLTTGGNPALEEEPSDSWTVGMVLTPSLLQDFLFSIDFWSIKLRGAMASIAAQKAIDLCVDSPSVDNVFCSAIDRIADNTIEVVRTTPINIGRLEAEGVDLQAQYQLDLARFEGLRGNLAMALTGTRVNDLREIVNPADPTSVMVRSGGIHSPTWRGNLYTRYALGAWSASWNLRYIDSARIDPSRPLEFYDRPTVSSRIYHDLHADYDLNDAVNLYAGINNLLNEMPPLTAQTYQGTGAGALYDNLGRFFFVGGTIRF